MDKEPSTLQEAIIYFSYPVNCRNYVVARRWPKGVTCPICGSEKVKLSEKHNRWQCGSHHARRQFTVKTGTIFEDSPLGLDKWLTAVWMITNDKNGISSYEVSRALGVTQKTAWFMLHRIRKAMQLEPFMRLAGEIEVDETFIGGKARNMHIAQRERRITGTGTKDKVTVMGILERGGQVRTSVVENRRKAALQSEVKKHVEAGSSLYSDELKSYDGLAGDYAHQVINHAVAYVDGKVHTNGLENFWSLLKRGIHGTYVSVEPFHLYRYLGEQCFRYNNRATKKHFVNDRNRFELAMTQVANKRLTYEQLVGRQAEQP